VIDRQFHKSLAVARLELINHALVIGARLGEQLHVSDPVPTYARGFDPDLLDSTPLSILEAIAAKIPGATLVRAPNAAHMPTIEQADLCNRDSRIPGNCRG
jgi:pimeloyl-ACP methyl ester carboxylesterase